MAFLYALNRLQPCTGKIQGQVSLDSQDIKSRFVSLHFSSPKTSAKPVYEDVMVAGGPVLIFS